MTTEPNKNLLQEDIEKSIAQDPVPVSSPQPKEDLDSLYQEATKEPEEKEISEKDWFLTFLAGAAGDTGAGARLARKRSDEVEERRRIRTHLTTLWEEDKNALSPGLLKGVARGDYDTYAEYKEAWADIKNTRVEGSILRANKASQGFSRGIIQEGLENWANLTPEQRRAVDKWGGVLQAEGDIAPALLAQAEEDLSLVAGELDRDKAMRAQLKALPVADMMRLADTFGIPEDLSPKERLSQLSRKATQQTFQERVKSYLLAFHEADLGNLQSWENTKALLDDEGIHQLSRTSLRDLSYEEISSGGHDSATRARIAGAGTALLQSNEKDSAEFDQLRGQIEASIGDSFQYGSLNQQFDVKKGHWVWKSSDPATQEQLDAFYGAIYSFDTSGMINGNKARTKAIDHLNNRLMVNKANVEGERNIIAAEGALASGDMGKARDVIEAMPPEEKEVFSDRINAVQSTITATQEVAPALLDRLVNIRGGEGTKLYQTMVDAMGVSGRRPVSAFLHAESEMDPSLLTEGPKAVSREQTIAWENQLNMLEENSKKRESEMGGREEFGTLVAAALGVDTVSSGVSLEDAGTADWDRAKASYDVRLLEIIEGAVQSTLADFIVSGDSSNMADVVGKLGMLQRRTELNPLELDSFTDMIKAAQRHIDDQLMKSLGEREATTGRYLSDQKMAPLSLKDEDTGDYLTFGNVPNLNKMEATLTPQDLRNSIFQGASTSWKRNRENISDSRDIFNGRALHSGRDRALETSDIRTILENEIYEDESMAWKDDATIRGLNRGLTTLWITGIAGGGGKRKVGFFGTAGFDPTAIGWKEAIAEAVGLDPNSENMKVQNAIAAIASNPDLASFFTSSIEMGGEDVWGSSEDMPRSVFKSSYLGLVETIADATVNAGLFDEEYNNLRDDVKTRVTLPDFRKWKRETFAERNEENEAAMFAMGGRLFGNSTTTNEDCIKLLAKGGLWKSMGIAMDADMHNVLKEFVSNGVFRLQPSTYGDMFGDQWTLGEFLARIAASTTPMPNRSTIDEWNNMFPVNKLVDSIQGRLNREGNPDLPLGTVTAPKGKAKWGTKWWHALQPMSWKTRAIYRGEKEAVSDKEQTPWGKPPIGGH